MPKFDTNVQELKYKVLREVARLAKNGVLDKHIMELPEVIIPGPEPTTRCCIYKERAIISQRVVMAMGGHEGKNEVEVLSIACDECPITQMTVMESCRGCIAHRCANSCPRNAISFPHHRAVIDHDKCIACGKCAAACPYSAIVKNVRPCERACKPGAISIGEDKKASINEEKCVSCGACVYQCPFGAIVDKSYMIPVINMLNAAKETPDMEVHAVVAPSISGQFPGATTGQVVSALKAMGFASVIEAALGADMVAYFEGAELVEKGFLTSSCCPAFVSYIKKNFPKMADKISSNLSPMAMIGKVIKAAHPESKVVFIGPCVAKKAEVKLDSVAPYVDAALTFEELQAMIDAYRIDLTKLADDVLNNASYYGRIFARSGGLCDAVRQALAEKGVSQEDFSLKAVPCSGLEECKIALLKAQAGKLDGNFIEGMACEQGCIGGPGCLTHGVKEKAEVDKYGALAKEKNIAGSMVVYDLLCGEK